MEKDFTDLTVWREAHQLTLIIYKICDLFPAEERYGLSSQLKRSTASIAANIAESYGRFYYQDNISFCRKSRGSLYETRNHIILAFDLNYIEQDDFQTITDKLISLCQLINGYIRHLEKKKITDIKK